jgi:hypothetical protein
MRNVNEEPKKWRFTKGAMACGEQWQIEVGGCGALKKKVNGVSAGLE